MKRILAAAVLVLALPAAAQVVTCVKVDSQAGFTLSCAAPNVAPPPPPPPPTTPVAPPAAEKPAPIGVMYGPDLTGTFGNPQLAYNISAGAAICYRYIGSGSLTFTAGGQATNGTPPAVWVWLEGAGGYVTTPVRFGGQGTAPVEATVSGDLRFCEQIEAPAGTAWNRYAQVNGASTTGGRVGTTVSGPAPR